MTFAVLAAFSIGSILNHILLILAAILALGVVVIIHELGHFIAAKKTGVKVEAFSVGFGPKIWGIKKGETEYRISLILFGGYVKMKGMEGEEGKEPHEIEGGFFAAPPGRRAFIAFAAPAMNVLLALAVFTVLWLTGRKVPQEYLTTSIGYFEEGSPAREAGLRPGDTIVKVNDKPVHEWKDVLFGVAFSRTNPVALTVRRNGSTIEKEVLAQWDKAMGIRMLGIHPRMNLLVGDVEKDSLAEKIGLRKKDKFVSLAGEQIYHIGQFKEILRANIGKQVSLVVSRDQDGSKNLTLSFTVPSPDEGITVASVKKGSAAAKARLRRGDVVVAANGQKVTTVAALREILNAHAGQEVRLRVLRPENGSLLPMLTAPGQNEVLGARLEEAFPVLGFIPDTTYGLKREDPFSATFSVIENVVKTLKGLVTRTVSAKGLSGPVGIVGWIAKSISISFTAFLYFIGFLSANLAVLNLLPIPVVDGGHIMFCAVEKIRKKPIRQKTMTIIVNVFVAFIVGFFLFVTWNDIKRFLGGASESTEEKVVTLRVPEAGVSVPPESGGFKEGQP